MCKKIRIYRSSTAEREPPKVPVERRKIKAAQARVIVHLTQN